MQRKTLIVAVIGVIAFAVGIYTIANPVQMVQALNPQPLPPGIIAHFHPPGPCFPTSVCDVPPGLVLHYPHP